MRLTLDDVSVSIAGKTLVRELRLAVDSGEIVGLVGPNGSGKSTALRCVYRALRPSSGAVLLDDVDLADLSLRESARSVAALTQETSVDLDFTVEEVVALGRFPHLRDSQALGAREDELCAAAMRRVDVAHLAQRGVLTLSGGERQRVYIARALVQEPRVLVLDEPTNHLDVRHQIELLSFLRGAQLTVLIALHDMNLAAATCDRIGVLSGGELVAIGKPGEVLTPELMREVFGVEATIVSHPNTGAPQLLYDLSPQPAQPNHRHAGPREEGTRT
ncbi:ABC transporter ATP-binding protein [Actinoalloteichus hymeniacidonis]|uniref:ABC-type cobalamin/Fe3+-siderophore transport system, ATPase component n=1 Tax=Actinoalloteichus hymeniacidonis TaxID=340345 RepID=A0AAC9HQT7_9PSEU|nr:ABC transporter ATP-binding protein [Actinoalloteichus hymeniacidonis]AOS63927.1 ABC-type cobalamin/Fe3+-siderophore transport system, ATPase component [Actinoalloteichus hymeniacidonis]MBB5908017.1 iron complex transport system ATP-binding protein [Actinoalloteichus hymeniacidonis]